jgi:prepilin-type N-terminal cleavage/methylation domain-containing protein
MKKAFTLMELLIVMAIVFILAALIAGGLSSCSNSAGSRAGIISKISQKGIAFKSWEGELMLGKGESANVWQFSVIDLKVVDQIKEAMRSGKRVELDYIQKVIPPVVRDTTYLVTKVTILDEQPQRKLEK